MVRLFPHRITPRAQSSKAVHSKRSGSEPRGGAVTSAAAAGQATIATYAPTAGLEVG
jgi:hypothetical protein